MIWSVRLIATFALAILAGVPITAFGLPKDLRYAGLALGCAPIKGFYDRTGQIEPDYLNMHDGTPIVDSRWKAAFWCKPTSKPKAFWLVFVLDGLPYHEKGCSPILEWNTPPRGLRVHSQKLELSSLSDILKKTPALGAGLTSYVPISDVYDGAGHAFYCHDKKWYSAPLH